MLKSILIGLDGSDYSEVALELGLQWAKQCDAVLVGLGIVDVPTSRSHEPAPIGGGLFRMERDEDRIAAARGKVERRLDAFNDRCDRAGVSCKVIDEAGLPYEEILRKSHRHDLVLLGHETHFHFETHDKPDQTLWRVLRRESRPVAIAPPQLQPGSSVVLAYDESPQADRALQAFQASGLDFGEEVVVLCIGTTEEQAGGQAEEAVEYLQSHGIRAASCPRMSSAPTGQIIVQEVRNRRARLLVMGVSRHSTLRDLLLGGVTKTVLRESPAPVFFSD